MKARQSGNQIELSFTYSPMLVSFVKTLPGRQYSPKTKSWYVPLAGGMPVLEKLAARGFEVDIPLLEAVKADETKIKEAEALATMDDTEFESPLPLFPYQKVGAAFLYQIESGLLGDEMGLGKTIQSIAVAVKAKAKKVLVFTPSSVKWQWAGEIEKFVPGAKVIVIEGTVDKRVDMWKTDACFYVVNYELLLRDFALMNAYEWDLIIADEATKISNATAKQSKLIKKLRSKRRIAATGTPVSNRAQEVWNIIDFTNPGALGNYYEFMQRYCLKNQFGGIFGYQNMDELKARLGRFMIRRLKKDVLKELPPLVRTDVPVILSAEEQALYKRLKKEILFEIEQTDIAKLASPMTIQFTLVKMLRLRQLTDSMELLGENKTSSKLAVLKELLETAIVDGKKAIIFTQFAEMADILERELADYKPLKISGTIKEAYKDVVDRFNKDDERQILIMTSAGQFGLNIQRASIIFHYDQEWSLAKMMQRDGRAHRYGQKETVFVYNLVARGTVDEHVQKILSGKSELSGQLLGDVPLTLDSIKELLQHE